MAEEKKITFANRVINGWDVWSVKGSLDTVTSPEAEAEGERLLSESRGNFIVELSELRYLSSAGMRILLRLAEKAKASGKTYALCAPQGIVKDVLRKSRMDMLMKIHDTTEELM